MKCIKCQRPVLSSSSKPVCARCMGLTKHATPVDDERRAYTCADCKFSFSSKRGRVFCGYCGGTNVVPSSQHTAEKLVRQS